eukprot:PhF_6_TR36327/c0_g1_i2/m.53176
MWKSSGNIRRISKEKGKETPEDPSAEYFEVESKRKELFQSLAEDIQILQSRVGCLSDTYDDSEDTAKEDTENLISVMKAVRKTISLQAENTRDRHKTEAELQQWVAGVMNAAEQNPSRAASSSRHSRRSENDDQDNESDGEVEEEIINPNASMRRHGLSDDELRLREIATDEETLLSADHKTEITLIGDVHKVRVEASSHFNKMARIASDELEKIMKLSKTSAELNRQLEEMKKYANAEKVHELNTLLAKKEGEKNLALQRWKRAIATVDLQQTKLMEKIETLKTVNNDLYRDKTEYEIHCNRTEELLVEKDVFIEELKSAHQHETDELRKKLNMAAELIQLLEEEKSGMPRYVEKVSIAIGPNVNMKLHTGTYNTGEIRSVGTENPNFTLPRPLSFRGMDQDGYSPTLSPHSIKPGMSDKQILQSKLVQDYVLKEGLRVREAVTKTWRVENMMLRLLFRSYKHASRWRLCSAEAKISKLEKKLDETTASMGKRNETLLHALNHNEIAMKQLPYLHRRNEELQEELNMANDDRFQLKKRLAELNVKVTQLQNKVKMASNKNQNSNNTDKLSPELEVQSLKTTLDSSSLNTPYAVAAMLHNILKCMQSAVEMVRALRLKVPNFPGGDIRESVFNSLGNMLQKAHDSEVQILSSIQATELPEDAIESLVSDLRRQLDTLRLSLELPFEHLQGKEAYTAKSVVGRLQSTRTGTKLNQSMRGKPKEPQSPVVGGGQSVQIVMPQTPLSPTPATTDDTTGGPQSPFVLLQSLRNIPMALSDGVASPTTNGDDNAVYGSFMNMLQQQSLAASGTSIGDLIPPNATSFADITAALLNHIASNTPKTVETQSIGVQATVMFNTNSAFGAMLRSAQGGELTDDPEQSRLMMIMSQTNVLSSVGNNNEDWGRIGGPNVLHVEHVDVQTDLVCAEIRSKAGCVVDDRFVLIPNLQNQQRIRYLQRAGKTGVKAKGVEDVMPILPNVNEDTEYGLQNERFASELHSVATVTESCQRGHQRRKGV